MRHKEAPPLEPISFTPIGVARTPFLDKASAPRQPAAAIGTKGTIELLPSAKMRDALSDLSSWKRIWVLFVFHEAKGWRPKVLPPRETSKRRGVLATRSPHRPNRIGLSALRLARVEECILHVLDVDLINGTPILDIKPYVAYTDSFPDDDGGWLEDPKSSFVVAFEPAAEKRLLWLEERGTDLRGRIRTQLALGPAPHAYRRIRTRAGDLELSVKDWRVDFRVDGESMRVISVRSGFRAKEVALGRAPEIHLVFAATFGM